MNFAACTFSYSLLAPVPLFFALSFASYRFNRRQLDERCCIEIGTSHDACALTAGYHQLRHVRPLLAGVGLTRDW